MAACFYDRLFVEMNQLLLPLVKREEVAKETMAFWLNTKGTGFSFKAGQHAGFRLINPPFTDDEGNNRIFSFASSPHQKDFVMIATRMRNTAFKNSLKEIPLGTKIEVSEAVGFFTLPPTTSSPIAFLAGGIGITPFRSMVEFAAYKKLPQEIYLFYSNRTRALAAFLSDFEEWAGENPNFKFVPTITQDEGTSDWKYEKGRINKNMLLKSIPNLAEPIYYIAGPDSFVVGTYEMLVGAGVSGERIKTEEFTGY